MLVVAAALGIEMPGIAIVWSLCSQAVERHSTSGLSSARARFVRMARPPVAEVVVPPSAARKRPRALFSKPGTGVAARRGAVATRALTADVTPPSETGRRRHRRRPYVVAGLGLLVLVALLVGMKALEIGKAVAAGKRAQAAGPPPEAVGSYEVQRQQWDETLTSVGSVAAARGVSISNDTSGIVWKIDFESGATVHRGQVLVELDTRVERAQLASAQAREQLAATNVQRTRALVASGSVAPSQLDTDQAAFAGATADANALAAQIERKTVRAPFAGKLGIRLVNVGQYLGPGTPITVLESSEATYVDFDLPQQDLRESASACPSD